MADGAGHQLRVNAGSCVHTRMLRAGCSACLQRCPTGAIDLSRRTPEIHAPDCTACGACIAACPEEVFALPHPDTEASGPVHVIACENHPSAVTSAFIPCIHLMTLRDLARLWLQGVRRLVIAPGECATCPMLHGPLLEETLADFNMLAKARGLEPLLLTQAGTAQAGTWPGRHAAAADGHDPARRALFRLFAGAAEEHPGTVRGGDALRAFQARGMAPDDRGRKTVPFAHSPHIDPQACTGCDDCINICPHQALTLIKAETGKAVYHMKPEHCTGCNLCHDICDIQAIEVRNMECMGPDIFLARYTCRACGIETHATGSAPPPDGLCRICRHTGHRKKLFVVLD